MTVWLPPILALALLLNSLAYALLVKPWRVKRLAYWLMARSTWYDHHVWRLMLRLVIEGNKKVAAAADSMAEAVRLASASMQRFNDALVEIAKADLG